MKRIFFAIKDNNETIAATSLSNIAPFVGYSADRLRRLLNASGGTFVRVKGARVYCSELVKIEGRGGFMRDNRT
jgi:hypothetical protein